MDAGSLNKRIKIQTNVGKDAYGQPAENWVDVASVWANIQQIGGREKLRAGAASSELTHTVAVRYRADLMPPGKAAAMRIVYGQRILKITAARDVEEDHAFIIFDCIEVTR